MIWREKNLNTMTGRTDIDHIPALPGWLGIIRVAQLILAIIIVGLVGYSSSVFIGTLDGHAMTFFTFAWTLLYFIYLAVATAVKPVIYHPWVHLGVEALTNLWWLVSWALLASEATTFDRFFGYGYGYGSWNRAIDCTKAAAGLGALEWLLFIVTLAFLGLSVFRSRSQATAAPVETTTAAPMEQHTMQNIV